MNNAYCQGPALYQETLYFVSDDDIWSVPKNGGKANRLTTSKGRATKPIISPDGKYIAYMANHDAMWDLYLMERDGGPSERLTFTEGFTSICSWKNNNTIYLSTSKYSFHPRFYEIFEFNIETKEMKKVPVGTGVRYQVQNGKALLGRNNGDPARWKRYKGGTAGTVWVDLEGKGKFKKILKNIPNNIFYPQWIDNRIFFITDHEGSANIYSVNEKGGNLKRHTHHEDFYVRSFDHYEGNIVYQCGAEIYLLNLENHHSQKIDIEVKSNFLQSAPRYATADGHMQAMDISDKAEEVIILTRGQIFSMAPWKGASERFGKDHHRYKCPTFINFKDDQELIAIEMSEAQEETITIFKESTFGQKVLDGMDWGKILEIAPHPSEPLIAMSTNRNQLWLVDVEKENAEIIDLSDEYYFWNLSWSPAGDYLAYSAPYDEKRKGIKLYHVETKESRFIIEPVMTDFAPAWDQKGRYLYFIGHREFYPVYNETHFDLGFPFASKIYAIGLEKMTPSPLELYLEFDTEDEEEEEEKDKTKAKGKKKSEKKKTKIDWEDIDQRIFSLPVGMGGHDHIYFAGEKLLFTKGEIEGISPTSNWRDEGAGEDLYCFCLKDKKMEKWEEDVSDVAMAKSGKYALLDLGDEVRLISTESKPGDGEDFNKKDGWVDLSRIRLHFDPKEEWRQMYQESWILQREHFWTPDMSKIDWEDVYIHYLPVLEKCHTRSEFSDLMWEMQGELGTGHCYEMFGDYLRRGEFHPNGQLGADFKFNHEDNSFQISKIHRGFSWIPMEHSPLTSSEVALKEGDKIVGIDGRTFEDPSSLDQMLEGRAGKSVSLDVLRSGEKEEETVHAKTLPTNSYLLYREWVEKNRKYVHQKSKGKLGYVHIPDMGVRGYSEFYTNFLRECGYEGLIVDVRFNGGGHISQHVLKILAQKVVGYDKTRWFGKEPYPAYAVNGPIVAITNEHAGSDGDIFSHAFKLMKIGKLIGKRTWGGVIGIWPRHDLNDGTLTTQPEFSHWFKDVGYDVENYGTDPDIEIEIMPDDYKSGKDPQLDRAITEALKSDKDRPVLKPNLEKRPNLKRPRLPKK